MTNSIHSFKLHPDLVLHRTCKVCRHVGFLAFEQCDKCRAFFYLSIKQCARYKCCGINPGLCPILRSTATAGDRCQYCWLWRCYLAGLSQEDVEEASGLTELERGLFQLHNPPQNGQMKLYVPNRLKPIVEAEEEEQVQQEDNSLPVQHYYLDCPLTDLAPSRPEPQSPLDLVKINHLPTLPRMRLEDFLVSELDALINWTPNRRRATSAFIKDASCQGVDLFVVICRSMEMTLLRLIAWVRRMLFATFSLDQQMVLIRLSWLPMTLIIAGQRSKAFNQSDGLVLSNLVHIDAQTARRFKIDAFIDEFRHQFVDDINQTDDTQTITGQLLACMCHPDPELYDKAKWHDTFGPLKQSLRSLFPNLDQSFDWHRLHTFSHRCWAFLDSQLGAISEPIHVHQRLAQFMRTGLWGPIDPQLTVGDPFASSRQLAPETSGRLDSLVEEDEEESQSTIEGENGSGRRMV